MCSLCILCRLCWSQCLMCCVYEICNMYAGCSVHSAVLNSVGSVPAERWTGVEAALLPVASLLLLLLLLPNASCTTALPGHRHRYTLQPSSHVLSNSLLIELDFLSSPYIFWAKTPSHPSSRQWLDAPDLFWKSFQQLWLHVISYDLASDSVTTLEFGHLEWLMKKYLWRMAFITLVCVGM